MNDVIANMDFVKERNISAVFKSIVHSNGISRIQIARQCNLAAGSVTRITRQLLGSGLIKEIEQQESERGRKATSLTACKSKIQIIAVRSGRAHIHIGLCDLSGALLTRSSLPFIAQNQQELGELIIKYLQNFIDEHQPQIDTLAGIGITTPGLVNAREGIIHYLPHLPVKDFPLGELVSGALNTPCYVANSTASSSLAEYHFGHSQGYRNNLLIRVHNGVSAGMILDGQLYEGNHLSIGEMGHFQINAFGEQCYCGNYGCLETEVANALIEKRCHQLIKSGHQSIIPDGAGIEQICEAANKDDALAKQVLTKSAGHLGKVIAYAVNLLRPECIVLSGEIFQAFDVVEPVIKHCLDTQTISVGGSQSVKLFKSKLTDKPWYSGFSLVRRALLERGLLLQILDRMEQV